MLKYLFSTVVVILLAVYCNAQLKDLLKQKVGEGVKQATINSTGKAEDKALDKLFSKKNKKNKSAETTSVNNDNTTQNEKDILQQPSLKTYSKYDFIPGAKIMGYDEFSGDAVGDFPAKWTTNASGEIMTVDNHEGKWLNISKEG